MVFGQVVIGRWPGSGKTSYCNGMSQFLNLIGRYDCAVNIEDLILIKLEDVMAEHSLGPNGAFNLDFYTDVEDQSYLQNHLDQDPCSAKYRVDAMQEKYISKITKNLIMKIKNKCLCRDTLLIKSKAIRYHMNLQGHCD